MLGMWSACVIEITHYHLPLCTKHGWHRCMLMWIFSRQEYPGLELELGVSSLYGMKVSLKKLIVPGQSINENCTIFIALVLMPYRHVTHMPPIAKSCSSIGEWDKKTAT